MVYVFLLTLMLIDCDSSLGSFNSVCVLVVVFVKGISARISVTSPPPPSGGVLSFLSVVKPGKCMLLFVVSLDSCIVAMCMLFCFRKCFSSCSLFLIPFMFICKMFNLFVFVELFG